MDLDGLTEAAWRQFHEQVAGALDALEPHEFVQVAVDAGAELDGAAPYVQILRDGSTFVIEVASNRFLDPSHRLRKPARRLLRDLGVGKPTEASPNYWIDIPFARIDQAAALVLAAFRDAHGVIHPAFLSSDDIDLAVESSLPKAEVKATGSLAVMPVDGEHLDRLARLRPASSNPRC